MHFMLKVRFTNQFKKDYRLALKRGCQENLFREVIEKLVRQEPLPERNKDHQLTGNWTGHRECHITPDWLLIYTIVNEELILELNRTGSHTDLFGKNRK